MSDFNPLDHDRKKHGPLKGALTAIGTREEAMASAAKHAATTRKSMSNVNPLDLINGNIHPSELPGLSKADEVLEKAQSHKYISRKPAPGGGYTYVYTAISKEAEPPSEHQVHTEADMDAYPAGTVLVSKPKKGRNRGKPIAARKRSNGNWDLHYPKKASDLHAIQHLNQRGVDENILGRGVLFADKEWKVHKGSTSKSQSTNPLDLVKATAPEPPVFRQGAVTYANSPAYNDGPMGSRPDLGRPSAPEYEVAERDTTSAMDLVRYGNGTLTHPTGVRRRDDDV
jgi:hypothetical protein